MPPRRHSSIETSSETSSDAAPGATTRHVPANGVSLCYETFGDPKDPALLMVMGLGCQLLHWDERLCRAIAAHGFFVIRYDHRDVGESTKLRSAGVPKLPRMVAARQLGFLAKGAPYDLGDLAADAMGLLDALGIDEAHFVGASMGGMVSQLCAITRPQRVRSLCSWMSTPGEARHRPTRAALGALMKAPPRDIAARIEHTVQTMRTIGTPGSRFDEVGVRGRAERALARDTDPTGAARHFAAVLASPPRTKALRQLCLPSLVIHGDRDPLVPLRAGVATARAIAGARLMVLDGVGHDIPPDQFEPTAAAIAKNARRAGH